jgi:hypothetical protein
MSQATGIGTAAAIFIYLLVVIVLHGSVFVSGMIGIWSECVCVQVRAAKIHHSLLVAAAACVLLLWAASFIFWCVLDFFDYTVMVIINIPYENLLRQS